MAEYNQAARLGKLLLIEDDMTLGPEVHRWLEGEGHIVDLVTTGSAAQDYLKVVPYDVIVLDWQLPDMAGIDLLCKIRAKGAATPILMLTAFNDLEHKIQGFENGADDYLTKPFFPKELGVRVKALLRRPSQQVENIIAIGQLEIDPSSNKVCRAGTQIKLTPREFNLLMALVRHPNTVLSAEMLMERAWPTDSDVSPEQIRKYVQRLRDKIDPADGPSLIRTVHGLGYSWDT